ncbi:Hsp20/alpha crystallin family protein [Bacillus sp. CGMCC 1.16607]|uniref:Hsp20/alpha crystallin family protein n=1 Tax=Bacillus sp. CGMCC 1.16607 TaxID=3351842 RepID=UPI003630CDC3
MFPWNFSPFNKKMNNQMGQIDQNEIEKFVQNMMGQMMPNNLQNMMKSQDWMKTMNPQQNEGEVRKTSDQILPYSVFETHNHVYIRIPIKQESWLKQMKLYHTSNQLIVEHVPDENEKINITLPTLVRKKGTTASYKDGILEIKIPKAIDMQYTEIEINDSL